MARSRRRWLTGDTSAILVEESITLDAKVAELDAIHSALERFLSSVSGVVDCAPGSDWRLRFTTAVAEIAANIVRHAYPSAEGTFRLRLYACTGTVHACFVDTGIEFVEARGEAHATAENAELAESGFGLNIARRC